MSPRLPFARSLASRSSFWHFKPFFHAVVLECLHKTGRPRSIWNLATKGHGVNNLGGAYLFVLSFLVDWLWRAFAVLSFCCLDGVRILPFYDDDDELAFGGPLYLARRCWCLRLCSCKLGVSSCFLELLGKGSLGSVTWFCFTAKPLIISSSLTNHDGAMHAVLLKGRRRGSFSSSTLLLAPCFSIEPRNMMFRRNTFKIQILDVFIFVLWIVNYDLSLW